MLSASTFCLRALLRLQHCNVPVIAGWLCPRAWLGAPYERLLSARALRLLYDLSLYGLIVSRSAFCPHVLLPFLFVWPSPLSPWQRLVTLSSPYTYVKFRSHQG
jgi:hypothetical protein